MEMQRSKSSNNPLVERSPTRGTADTIELLSEVTARIRVFARKLIPIVTIVNTMIFVILFALPRVEKIDAMYAICVLVLTSIIQSITIFQLVAFDGLIRDGDVYYGQISDELEWHHKSELGSVADQSKQRRVTHARLIMRQFLNEASLPIVRGRIGVLTYFIINFGFFIAIVYMTSRWYIQSLG